MRDKMRECKYKISKEKLPYPRVMYDCECGFKYVMLEGYEQKNYSDSGGGKFAGRTKNLLKPQGICSKCKKKIII